MADREPGQNEGTSRESSISSDETSAWETVSFEIGATSEGESAAGDEGEGDDEELSGGAFLPGVPTKSLPKGPARRFGVRKIIGDDDRKAVADVRANPYCWICSLEITPPNRGVNFFGTGWLIGPRTVVTAGHCVYCNPWKDEDSGRTYGSGPARSIKVIAGRKGRSGLAAANAVNLFSVDEWTRSQDERYDFGAILLDQPIGTQLGFFGFAAATDRELEGPPAMNVNVAGYPGKTPGTMLMHANRIVDATPTQILYQCDTTGGQSGSPVIHWDGSTRYTVVGIHNQGSDHVNYASRITTAALAKLREWKQAGT